MRRFTSHERNLVATTLIIFLAAITLNTDSAHAVSWSSHENRLTTNPNFDGLAAITQTSDAKLWVLWQKERLGNYTIVYITSMDFGASWSTEKTLVISNGHNTHPSIRQSSNGTLWLFWSSDRTGNYEIFYRTSSNLGASWSGDVQLTNSPYFDVSPSVVTASNGWVWVFWSSNRLGNYEIFYRIYNGFTWSVSTQLTNDPQADRTPFALRTKDGNIWVAWETSRFGDFEIMYEIYNGTTWLGEKRLTSDTNVDTVPAILQTADGLVWIFWASSASNPNGTDDIYYKTSGDKGVTWSSAVQFTTDPYDDTWPAVYQTSDTKIWVLWTSDRVDQPDWGNFDVWYRTSIAGDINNDGIVNVLDLATVAQAFGTKSGDADWNPSADINCDNKIDIDDLIIVGRNYGST